MEGRKILTRSLWEDSTKGIKISVKFYPVKGMPFNPDNIMVIKEDRSHLLTNVDDIKVSDEDMKGIFIDGLSDSNESCDKSIDGVYKDHNEDGYIDYGDELEYTEEGFGEPLPESDDSEKIAFNFIEDLTVYERIRVNIVRGFIMQYLPEEVAKDIEVIAPNNIQGPSNSKMDSVKAIADVKFVLIYRPDNLDYFDFTTNVSAKGIQQLIPSIIEYYKTKLDWSEVEALIKTINLNMLDMLNYASISFTDINIYDANISLLDMINCYSYMGEKYVSYNNGERIIKAWLDNLIDTGLARAINYEYENSIWMGIAYNKVMFIPDIVDNHVRIIVYDNKLSAIEYDDNSTYDDTNIVDQADIELGDTIIEDITSYLKIVYMKQFHMINHSDIG